MASFLQNLSWRYATKSFLPEKRVTPKNLEKILTAIQLAPTSFGLEPFHIVVVTSPELRKKIEAAAWNQAQIMSCSYLLVFCARTDISPTRIDHYFEIASDNKPEKRVVLARQEEMMRGSMQGMPAEKIADWSARQAYIALGFGLAACAELQIDSCPMEGFSGPEVDKILELPAHI